MLNPELNPGGKVRVALTLVLKPEELQEQKERLASLVATQAYPVFESLVGLLAQIQYQACQTKPCPTTKESSVVGTIVTAEDEENE
jgi:hypothetical protein